MDRLFNNKSRMGWFSLGPILVLTLLIFLLLQSAAVYLGVMNLSSKYTLNSEYVSNLGGLLILNVTIGAVILSAFIGLLLIIYFFEKNRRIRQSKNLTENINKLSILSMIKENTSRIPREKM